MKKIILILIAMTMLYGCEEKSKIELVPEIDMIYKSINLVPQIAMPLNEPLVLPFEEAIKEVHKKENPNEDVIYPIYVRLYISEKGEIDKIKVLRHMLDARNRKSTNPKYDEKIYLYPEKIITKALPELEKVKFSPAESNGKKIKMRADVKVIYFVNKNGELKIDKEKMKREHAKSDFDNPVQGIFFVAVEEMPEPIGGIKAIQKNIVYPEIAKRAGIEGRVYVKAYVDSTGKVVKTEILRGIGGGCDEVAEAAVKKVEFIPGKQRGKRMNVQVTVPILFKLNGDSNKTLNKKTKNSNLYQ